MTGSPGPKAVKLFFTTSITVGFSSNAHIVGLWYVAVAEALDLTHDVRWKKVT